MSDNFLILIPTDPAYVPDLTKQQAGRDLLASFVPLTDSIAVEVTEKIQFVDQGSNWERVTCPVCGNELEVSLWQELMDEAYQTKFSNLITRMPCCESFYSLNDLNYEWPAGFARFLLTAINPNTDINIDQIQALEKVLECKLRKIWRHS